MDDIKLFSKNENELETLIQEVRIYSEDIGWNLVFKKCAMLIMKSGKWHMTDGMKLSNKIKNRTLEEKETYKHL